MTRWIGIMLALLSVSVVFAQPRKADQDDPEPFDRSLLALRGTLESASLVALITDPDLAEISGIAASRRHPGLFWVHNDSGDSARLFAIDRHGKRQASLRLQGVNSRDWEDVAAFRYRGHDYLLVADTGDNGGVRHELSLQVVEEPDALGSTEAPAAWTIRFRWPDGPRDCEAVAVDAVEGYVYLVSKKRIPAELWRVTLAPADRVLVAEEVTTLGGIIQPTERDLQLNPVYGRYRSQITGADLSPDRKRLVVLNYRGLYVFERNADGQWPAERVEPVLSLDLPWLPQAEAIAFDPDGKSVWVSSERLPAPLLHIVLETAGAPASGQHDTGH
ncbi:MAG: hypothetical protein KDI75_04990 [Xanthomonadales bacterium]|nr:hypothetical protein [Xanthomonadales bacterium]